MSVQPPLFVLAPPFCGASFVAGCLGRHPQLYAVPELCLMMADELGELAAQVQAQRDPGGLAARAARAA